MLFVRSPEAEGVKSRLAVAIGEERARQVYRRFVLDLLDTLHDTNHCLRLCFSPPDHRDAVSRWLGGGLSYVPQTGENLGERMKNAFVQCFAEGCEAAILIGSDLPDLPAEFIDQGFASLKENDVVVGPALDGGYYLIGFNADPFLPEAFTGIPWGTDSVEKTTRSILERRGLSIAVLPQWRDIDTYEDLIALRERNRETPFAQSRTMQYISSQLRSSSD